MGRALSSVAGISDLGWGIKMSVSSAGCAGKRVGAVQAYDGAGMNDRRDRARTASAYRKAAREGKTQGSGVEARQNEGGLSATRVNVKPRAKQSNLQVKETDITWQRHPARATHHPDWIPLMKGCYLASRFVQDN